jgi:hypothetical protein
MAAYAVASCRHFVGAVCFRCAVPCEPDAPCGQCDLCLDAIETLGLGDDVEITPRCTTCLRAFKPYFAGVTCCADCFDGGAR